MNGLTGGEFTELIICHGTEATIEKLKNVFDKDIFKDIFKYLRKKNCPEPYYCAEEIVQLTWKAVYLDIEKYLAGKKNEEYTNPAGWIFRIHRRYCIKDILSHIRTDQRFVSLDALINVDIIDQRNNLIPPFNNHIESQHYRQEILNIVRSEIFNLPHPKLIAFELFINGFEHKEIAFFLDIEPVCSRQWISRTLRIINRRINKVLRGEKRDV